MLLAEGDGCSINTNRQKSISISYAHMHPCFLDHCRSRPLLSTFSLILILSRSRPLLFLFSLVPALSCPRPLLSMTSLAIVNSCPYLLAHLLSLNCSTLNLCFSSPSAPICPYYFNNPRVIKTVSLLEKKTTNANITCCEEEGHTPCSILNAWCSILRCSILKSYNSVLVTSLSLIRGREKE